MKLDRALFAKPKFQKLMLVVGDRQKASGILSELYILAKDHYLPRRQAIPQNELLDWELPIELLMKLGFLEKEPDGYYMKGSEQAFAYYFDDYFNTTEFKSKAGKASAESDNHYAMRGPDGRFIPREVIAELEKTRPRGTSLAVWVQKKLGRKKKKVAKKRAKKKVSKKAKAVKKKKGSTKRTQSRKKSKAIKTAE